MPVGTLKLHRFNGLESFSVEKAEISYSKDEDGMYAVTFEGDGGAALSTLPDTCELPASPNFEFTLLLSKAPQAALTVGKAFQIVKGHDEKKGDYWTRFYYVEHEVVDEVSIRIVGRADQSFQVVIHGVTPDVNYYDGSKPPTRIEIEAQFHLKV